MPRQPEFPCFVRLDLDRGSDELSIVAESGVTISFGGGIEQDGITLKGLEDGIEVVPPPDKLNGLAAGLEEGDGEVLKRCGLSTVRGNKERDQAEAEGKGARD
jgi:hypothetical protein